MADARLGGRLLASLRLARHERAVERAVLRAIHNQRAKAVALLRVVRADAIPANLFDDASWMDELDQTVRPVVEGIFAEISADAGRFGTGPLQLPTIDLTRHLDRLLGSMRGLSVDISAALGRTLTEGVNRGESIDRLSARVRDVFDGVGESRVRQIARTETHGATEGASHDAAGALHRTGTSLEKTWLATNDARTRPDHRDADGQTVPYDQPFKVGGHALEYPGDPGGPVEQIVNCRCTTLFGPVAPITPDPVRITFSPSDFTAEPAKRVGARGPYRTGGHLEPLGPKTKVAKGVRTANAAIDQVHRSPRLVDTPLPVEQTSGTRTLGRYQWDSADAPLRIQVSAGSEQQAMTFAHEFGHFFDHQDWNDPKAFTTFKAAQGLESPIARWWAAVSQSPTLARLRDLQAMARFRSEGGVTYPINHNHVSYLLDAREIWARSYAQWIAVESGDPAMLAELESMRKGRDHLAYYPHQWEDEEFAPIAEAFREVFRAEGLLNQ